MVKKVLVHIGKSTTSSKELVTELHEKEGISLSLVFSDRVAQKLLSNFDSKGYNLVISTNDEIRERFNREFESITILHGSEINLDSILEEL